jgi:hypothetical protein
MYKYILERRYNVKVVQMIIVCLHPDNENYIVYDIKGMEEIMDLFLKQRMIDLESSNNKV